MDAMGISVQTHVFLLFVFLSVMIYNYYTVSTEKDFMTLAKKLRYRTPFYHTINAMIIYTGMILAAFNHDLSPTVLLMIPTGIFLLVIEIKRYKKMRVIKLDQKDLQIEFVAYAKKIYIIEASVLISMYLIAKLF